MCILYVCVCMCVHVSYVNENKWYMISDLKNVSIKFMQKIKDDNRTSFMNYCSETV